MWSAPPSCLLPTPKPELPAKSNCACCVLACILTQIWMDLASLAGETFSYRLEGQCLFQQYEKGSKKTMIHSCESVSQLPYGSYSALFRNHNTLCLFHFYKYLLNMVQAQLFSETYPAQTG